MKITTLLYSLIYLCAYVCGCGEDEDYEEYRSLTPDLISVMENQTQYQVNDTLFFSIEIPRSITTVENQVIDIFETTGVEIGTSNFSLFKTNNFDNPQSVSLSQNELISNENTVTIFDDGQAFNTESLLSNNSYSSSVGIILKEPGSYFLTGRWGSAAQPRVYFLGTERVSVELRTTIVGANEEYRYLFEVQ